MSPAAQLAAIEATVAETLTAAGRLNLPDRCRIILGAHGPSGGHVSLFPSGRPEWDHTVAQLDGDGLPTADGGARVWTVGPVSVWVFLPDVMRKDAA
jgi:hypothetical protein